jgi:hypothetical protein
MSDYATFLPLIVLSGCSRIIHPAAVHPGLAIDIVPGVERVRHAPSETSQAPQQLMEFDTFDSVRPLGHVSLSYGWRSTHFGAQLGIAAGLNSAPVVDGYFQFINWPLDGGVGVTLSTKGTRLPRGLVPGVYGMIGREWIGQGGVAARADLGVRRESVYAGRSGWVTGINPFLLVSVAGWLPASVGVWIDARSYSEPVLFSMCDDACRPRDLAKFTGAMGLFIRMSPVGWFASSGGK